jgi:aminoglycoside phosphotransferase (APT) family kinase protein
MNTLPSFTSSLEAYLSTAAGGQARLLGARQLTGGASRATWSLDVEIASGPEHGHHALILRADLGGTISDDALTREQEFHVVEAAHRAGVRVARPRWLCTDPGVLGVPFFLVDRVEGESVGRRVVREPALAEARSRLPRQMGQQLALIHAIRPEDAGLSPPPESPSPARSIVQSAADELERLGEPHPALELALRWLLRHAPDCPEWVLCHGDFRVGNLMVGPEGLVAVFDWEFAHVGDPAEDLAWPCVRSWRFGNDALHLGGIGSPDGFLESYLAHSGRDRNTLVQRLSFWEILGNFRWAVGCLRQAHRHLSGQAPSIELASLGRRTAEMELELLDLIDRTGLTP